MRFQWVVFYLAMFLSLFVLFFGFCSIGDKWFSGLMIAEGSALFILLIKELYRFFKSSAPADENK